MKSSEVTTNPYQISFNFDDIIILKDFFKMTKEWLAENNMNLPTQIKTYIDMFEQYKSSHGFKSDICYLFKMALQEEYIKARNKKSNVYSSKELMQYASPGQIVTNNYALINWINVVETLYNNSMMKNGK